MIQSIQFFVPLSAEFNFWDPCARYPSFQTRTHKNPNFQTRLTPLTASR